MGFGPAPGKRKCWSRSTAGPLFIMAGEQGHIRETGGRNMQSCTDEQVMCGRRLDKARIKITHLTGSVSLSVLKCLGVCVCMLNIEL